MAHPWNFLTLKDFGGITRGPKRVEAFSDMRNPDESLSKVKHPNRLSSGTEEEISPGRLIDELREYVGFTEQDARLLREMGPLFEPHLPALADKFYATILRNEPTRRIIEEGGHDLLPNPV